MNVNVLALPAPRGTAAVRTLAHNALGEAGGERNTALRRIESEADASVAERSVASAALEASTRTPVPQAASTVQDLALRFLSKGAVGPAHVDLGRLGDKTVQKLESASDKVVVAGAYVDAVRANAPNPEIAAVATTACSLAERAMYKAHALALAAARKPNYTFQLLLMQQQQPQIIPFTGTAKGHTAAAAALQNETLGWFSTHAEVGNATADRALSAIGEKFVVSKAVEDDAAALALGHDLMTQVGRHSDGEAVQQASQCVRALVAPLEGASRPFLGQAFGAVARGSAASAAQALRVGTDVLGLSPAKNWEISDAEYATSPANVWRMGIYDWLDKTLPQAAANAGADADAQHVACASSVKNWVDVAAINTARHTRELDANKQASGRSLRRRRKTKLATNIGLWAGVIGCGATIMCAKTILGSGDLAVNLALGAMAGILGAGFGGLYLNGRMNMGIQQAAARYSELQSGHERSLGDLEKLREMQKAIDAHLGERATVAPATSPELPS